MVNRKYLPDTGGAVLVCNHVSWLDGFLLLLVSSRRLRMVVFSGNFAGDWLTRWVNVLPTSDVRDAIREAVGHDRIRYIEPGGVVTMDLRPDRLNVETGVDGRIKTFRCG